MKQYGSWSELVSIVFREDTFAVTFRPNQSTTYTAARDIQLPPGDANHVIVSADSTQTLTNKTISGANNTISNINLASQVTGTLPIANGGTGQTTATAATNALLPSQAAQTGKVLGTDGTNTSWVTAPTPGLADGTIFVGNASNVATSVSMTGDVTIDNTGVTTVASATGDFTLGGATTYTGAVSVSGTVNSQSVAGVSHIVANTGSADVTLNGLTGGVLGQVVYIRKGSSSNDVIINHNSGSGSQKFLLPAGLPITLSNQYGGVVAVFQGSFWQVISMANDSDFGSQNITTTGSLTVGDGTDTHTMTGSTFIHTGAGGITDLEVVNTSTGNSRVFCDNNTGTGDAYLLTRAGSQLWSVGIDQSASQTFKISNNSNPSAAAADDFLEIATTGGVTLGATSQTAPHTIRNANTGDCVLYVRSLAAADASRAPINIVKTSTSVTDTQNYIWFLSSGGSTNNGSIRGVSSGVADFNTISDLRLKENIQPIESTLNKILALKPCTFDYRDGSGPGTGFIAQEMQEVFPDCVSTSEINNNVVDPMLSITGWSRTDARLVKAIQEQQAIIEQLTSRIEALEASQP